MSDFNGKDKSSEKIPTVNKTNSENTYFITLPQPRGSPPQIIPICAEQLTKEIVLEEGKQSDSPLSNIVYKIIKPEDLQLKPNHPKYLPRGRPRKKASVTPEPIDIKKQVIKQARTRSGRITKPPKHIEVDFKKIDIIDDTEINESEPLKSDEVKKTEEPLLSLEQHCKKRTIPPRYRCPTCNKAYLGKSKMLSHFEKYPDHGSVPNDMKNKNTTTWDFLLMTVQKFKGSKTMKFCEEIEALLENVKKIAKHLFKPARDDNEERYFINTQLANVFKIKEGSYVLDETELSKDIHLYEYLERNKEKENEISSCKRKGSGGINTEENTQNSLALVKYEIPKLFNFNVTQFQTATTSNNADYNCQQAMNKNEQNKLTPEKKGIFHDLSKEITLQNELHDVDELMLETVDTGQVNILETSSNSDDIMNVDQFVNERFKKLTEPDMDIQGNTLNLELPPLDIFQFHTT